MALAVWPFVCRAVICGRVVCPIVGRMRVTFHHAVGKGEHEA